MVNRTGAHVSQKIEKSSSIQTIISLTILVSIAVIALSIFLAQQRFNPAVLQLDVQGSLTGETIAAEKPIPTENLISLPADLLPLSALEQFDSATLSDKINGKAELYLSSGFVAMQSQRFKNKALPDLWMEMFVYDMGTPQNAFSVFSVQRRDDAEPLELTGHAYRTPNAVFLVHGPFYLEIVASDVTSEVHGPMQLLAETFVRNTRVEAAKVSEKDLFPPQGLQAENIAMIAANAFGFESFDKVFTSLYETGEAGSETMAFVSHRSSAQEAADLAAAYQKFLLAFDGRIVEAELPIKGATMIEILDTYEIVFAIGPYLAGVREAEDTTQATGLASRLYAHLKEVSGAR